MQFNVKFSKLDDKINSTEKKPKNKIHEGYDYHSIDILSQKVINHNVYVTKTLQINV